MFIASSQFSVPGQPARAAWAIRRCRHLGVDCDALDLTLCLGALADRDGQYAILELGLDLVGINVRAELDGALELAVPALAIHRTIGFGFLLAFQRQPTFIEG